MPAHAKPTALKRIQGTYRKDRTAGNEPEIPLMLECVPPESLQGIALETWHRESILLVESGILTEADLIGLEQYCSVYATFFKASRLVESDGVVLESVSGVKKNPAVGVKIEASRELRSLSATLGVPTKNSVRMSQGATVAGLQYHAARRYS